jgi:hypothetical protein
MSSSRRRTGSSGRSSRRRRDRYGIEDEGKYNDDDIVPTGYSSSNRLLASTTAVANTATADGMDVDPVLPTPAAGSQRNSTPLREKVSMLYRGAGNFETDGNDNAAADDDNDDDEGNEYEPLSPTRGVGGSGNDVFRDEEAEERDDDEESYEEYEITLQELLYSTSAFYAIVVPGTFDLFSFHGFFQVMLLI